MKKHYLKCLFIILSLIILQTNLFGQASITLGPDITLPCDSTCVVLTATVTGITGSTSSYTLDSTGITWPSPYSFDIAGSTAILYTDDEYSNAITLPFPFCFYGTSYSQILIGTNSDMVFDLGLAGSYDPWPIDYPIPSTTYSSPAIMGCYGDWETSAAYPIKYATAGTAPNRVFIENITTYEFSCTGKRVKAQVVLHETTNIIDVYIQQRDVCPGWNDGDYITGLQKSSTVAIAFPGHNQTAWGGDSLDKAYRFIPSGSPTVYLLSSTGAVLQTITNPDSTGVGTYTVAFAVQCPSVSPTSYIAEVEGCSATVLYDTINVYSGGVFVPVAGSNSPVCSGDSLLLTTTGLTGVGSVIYSWTGPNGFTSSLQNPSIPGATTYNSGIYSVTVTNGTCSSTVGTVNVTVNPTPSAPELESNSPVCSGNALNLTATAPAGAVYSWSGPAGFTSPMPNPVISPANTLATGLYSVIVTLNGCVSPIATELAVVDSTPVVPVAQSNSPVCSGNTLYLAANDTTGTGVAYTWTGPNGFVSEVQNPSINAVTTAASGTYVVTASLGTCSSSSSTSVLVNLTPTISLGSNAPICYGDELDLTATGAAGDTYSWAGPNGYTSIAQNPVIAVATTAATGVYSVLATLNGCVSPLTTELVIVRPLPAPPVTQDLKYCQFSIAPPLTAIGDSLVWYDAYDSVIDSVPVPPTNIALPAAPVSTTWYVTQSTDSLGITCTSYKSPLTVTTVFLPHFTITPSSPFVCQYDSINITYTGPYMYAPGYSWVLPDGASVVDGTSLSGMPSIVVQFDSTKQDNYVYLTSTDDSGFCSAVDTILIDVVAIPSATDFTKNDVCLGDTTSLALSFESYDAAEFTWQIDSIPLASSSEVNVIASNSNSSGPYKILWNDSGKHVIQLIAFSKEGCQSSPYYDTVNVHPGPDASFIYKIKNESLCIEDSVLFIALDSNYNDAFTWGPSGYFNNVNTPSSWGKVGETPSIITLNVTDPFGCSANSSMALYPGTCCTATFPNAFTPNGDGKNDYFRPIYFDSSVHNLHDFRIANRWGQTVFETTSSSPQWDGTFNGVPQDMGIYYYYIKFDCGGNTVEQKGDVTLIR